MSVCLTYSMKHLELIQNGLQRHRTRRRELRLRAIPCTPSSISPSCIMVQARHTDVVEEHCISGEAVPEGAVEFMEERMPE